MIESDFQVSGIVGSDIEWKFGSRLVIQVAKDLEPDERLILSRLRFKCDQRYFKVVVQAHGYSPSQGGEYTSVNLGQGDEAPNHTLISNASGHTQKGWISIYFHAEPPETPLDGPQELHHSDGVWCKFAIEGGVAAANTPSNPAAE
ncbi:MAG: hypothetical protein KZQ88_18300 [Candidatus Thiodiazotropha sp. (ex Dulcina madagascariensis)]|nr:hypothetical protein [Candidatus Thiodiazotropha sp. (ex Dulcina madagascariensis)]MCU7925505.1 hypothetical protein [Candidatus Thiodiazotropha sp. (ex Dulcina madagascariensis)]